MRTCCQNIHIHEIKNKQKRKGKQERKKKRKTSKRVSIQIAKVQQPMTLLNTRNNREGQEEPLLGIQKEHKLSAWWDLNLPNQKLNMNVNSS